MAMSKGKATRPSKVVKPKTRIRRTTETTRNHRYKSFNERIGGLKIDPVRRKREHEEREALTDDRATYFGRSLARWRDVNLSHDFVSFANKSAPLVENLPLLLHNQEQIFTLLLDHIERRDALALEPLLGLLADFAHDLDTRFEAYFPQAVQTVTGVAAKHQDPAVVEWSFNCLAWLFKYLSRLLAPDLRAVYDLMAPFLGKEQQKHYIVRFAAESMCFLLRKAAASYERDSAPLNTIIQHILTDLSQYDAEDDLYEQGVMVLLTDAIKGVQQSTHSAGPAIIQTLLQTVRDAPSASSKVVVRGVLTSLIHFSTASTFAPALGLILDDCESNASQGTTDQVGVSAELLFVILSVRKGSRVTDWTRMLKLITDMAEAGRSTSDWTGQTRRAVASVIAVTILYCSDSIKLLRASFLDCISQDTWSPYFLHICDFVARIDHERYSRTLSDKLQSFVRRPQTQALDLDELLILLPTLAVHAKSGRVSLPENMQSSLVKCIQSCLDRKEVEQQKHQAQAVVVLHAMPHLSLTDAIQGAIGTTLHDILEHSLDAKDSSISNRFVLGPVLSQWLAVAQDKALERRLFDHICDQADTQYTVPGFWKNVLTLISRLDEQTSANSRVESLHKSMALALTLADHRLRETVLDLYQAMLQKQGKEIPAALATAILIESTPLSLETSRSISMNIRRLASEYNFLAGDEPLVAAIPAYCLSLLQIRLSSAWDDAIDTLGHICKSTAGEQTMMQIVQQWLFEPPSSIDEDEETPLITAGEPIFQVRSDFECPNLARMTALSEQAFNATLGGRPGLEALNKQVEHSVPVISLTARSQALRLLNRLPHIAEKRSKLIVPTLLKWTGTQEDGEEDITSAERWNRKDQKAMLNAFAQFQNPRVLYKSTEVYDALLNLCKNGDVEIQKAALKALLAWKTPEIVRYEEHLNALTDETRFREELSVFLQGDEEDGIRRADLPIVMPVLLRLLYGRLIGGSKEGQQTKRKAVFVALSTFPAETMAMFVDIALSSTKGMDFIHNGTLQDTALAKLSMPPRQQLGMLNMFGDMVETLGSALQPFAATILDTILACTIQATRTLSTANDNDITDTSLLRGIRQNGLQGAHKIFSSIDAEELALRCQVVATELLPYRLDNFVAENSQGISATLRLASAWAASENYLSYLTLSDDRFLTRITDLFAASTTKEEVRLFLLQSVLDPLLARGNTDGVPESVVSHIANSIATSLSGQQEKAILDACVRTLELLVPRLHDDGQAKSILSACQSLLVRSSKVVSIRTKLGLLRTMTPLLDIKASLATPELYHAVCGLFSRLHDLEGRAILAEVFVQLAQRSAGTMRVAEICQNLNKLSGGKLDQPDLDSREQAFFSIYEEAAAWNWEQWVPIAHNCLYFLRDEDTVNRASAAKALRQLITAATKDDSLLPLIQNDLFGAVQRGMSQKSEFVRAEYLALLHAIVLQLPDWKEVSDMQTLAFDGDEEASFFTNVLHIQQHRRLRALRRIGETSKVNSKNILRIFLPLLEQCIFDQAPGDAGRTLADQAVQSIGDFAQRLRWSDLRQVLMRYYGYLKTKEELEKTVLRLIGSLIDGLTLSLKVPQGADADNLTEDAPTTPALAQNRIDAILKDYLPPLQHYLHQKDESKVDRRVGVAVSIVKLARLLPEEDFVSKLAPTLTDISHILRSRDGEAREQTRRTLSTILGLVGSTYLQFILKELRSALLRGYQLHVLSYTVHSLLVANGSQFKAGDVDECIPELTSIILDDIFGITGQEKDAEEYKSGMKEVKSSKSYDTMEIVARMASPAHLGQLILPIRAMLSEKLDARLVKKIDDLLLRVQRGIDQNAAADTRDLLIFCHELVRQVHAQKVADTGLEGWKLKKYLSQNGKRGSATKGSTTSYLFKLTAFALALLRKVLRRHESLQTPANLAGFLPMVGDGLVAGESEVKIESAKLLSTILRVELPEIDRGIEVYLKEAIGMVKGSQSTTSESARAGMELATAILRDRREATLRDRDVAVLLMAIKADIDEPDRQGQTFRFLRSVLGRKVVIPEVYELMDEVARMMVNNSDESIRQNARAAYVQFVVDFPQGKARWDKTTAFLVKNMAYEHASGRRSVLEVIHTLLGRISDDAAQDILLGLFIGLVQRIISDADIPCKEMATILVQRVLEKSEDEQEQKIKSLANKWVSSDKSSIRQAAIASWTIITRAGRASKRDVDQLIHLLSDILKGPSQLALAGTELLQALCETMPQQAFAQDTSQIWRHMLSTLSSDAEKLQDNSVKLLALLYNDVASTTAKHGEGLKAASFQTSAGLKMNDKTWCQHCAQHLQTLRNTPKERGELISAVCKNLILFGRLFAANDTRWHTSQEDKSDAESGASGDDSDGDNDNEKSALGYVLSRLVYTVRREGTAAVNRTAALTTAGAIITMVGGNVPHVKLLVRALYVLTDPSIPQPPGEEHRLLTDKAREVMDILQSKLGAQQYIEMLSEARKQVAQKRDERRRKRKIDAVAQPERFQKEKRRKNEAKKANAKAKAQLHQGRRRGW